MKIGRASKMMGLLTFTMAATLSHLCGASYWDAMTAGSVFGLFMMFLASDEG